MQNITVEKGSDLTAVKYFASGFSHVHQAGTKKEVKDFILLLGEAVRQGKQTPYLSAEIF